MAIFDFFNKKKDEKPEEDQWVLAQALENDKLMIFRFRDNVPDGVEIKDYPYLISILWEYETDNPNGMPSSDIYEKQIALDDALDVIDNKGAGMLMVSITGKGRKEWIWYINDPEVWIQKFHNCLVGHPVYPLQLEQSLDASWEAWKSIREGAA